ncbi:ABC transporter ATP-binding protein/permease [Candidatus Parcubacteria bacterium]|nr:ABC transporter ATP-binding protein/permease [Candidatus Parcubacteria bacterium]
MPNEEKKRASAREVFQAYWGSVKEHPFFFAGVIAAILLVQTAELGGPLYLRQLFNLLTHAPEDAVNNAFLTLGMYAVFVLLGWVAFRAQGLFVENLEARVMNKLYNKAFTYTLGHSYNFFISNFAGALTHKIGRFSRAFESLFDAIVTQFFPAFLFIVGAIVVLYIRHPVLGLVLLGWSVLFITFQYFLSRLRQPVRSARAEAEANVTASVADAVANQNTVALFSGSAFEYGRFKQTLDIWTKATLRSWISDGWIQSSMAFLMAAVQIGLLYGAIVYWQEGHLTIGDFVLIQAYLITAFNRLVSINWQLRRFYDAFADSSEMVHILKTPHEIKDIPNAKELQVTQGEIVFDDVQFGFYKDSILKNFNLTLRGGERVALVGPSGAGKSTITKLLLRLYDVQGGAIYIDGQNIAHVTQDSLREAIAFVPQEPILFHRTLIENIRYGRRDATDEEVIEAAKKAHCHEFISDLPLKYETFVGERGIKLSGGERQRVAIARAILKNAPILVLDEATSSLDSESEAYIQDALENLMKEKTVMVIAHRLSTIMKMDRIVVMEKGEVVAQGTHLELINQKGLYQKLWSIQAGGFLGDGAEKE